MFESFSKEQPPCSEVALETRDEDGRHEDIDEPLFLFFGLLDLSFPVVSCTCDSGEEEELELTKTSIMGFSRKQNFYSTSWCFFLLYSYRSG